MTPPNDPGFAQTNPNYVDRDPGFTKRMPGPKTTPGPLATTRPPNTAKTKPAFIGPTALPSPSQIPGQPPGKVGGRPGSSTPPDRGNNSNRVATVIGKVGDYLGNVMRSARDVPTAFGTALDTKGSMAAGTNGVPSATTPIKNLATQIGQVGNSVLGKRDSDPSDTFVGPNKMYQNKLVRPIKVKPPGK